MRLDKYLKVSRIIKRRTIAKGISDLGFVKINDRNAKPASNVEAGDILELTLGDRKITLRVITTLFSTRKEDAKDSYEILRDEIIDLGV